MDSNRDIGASGNRIIEAEQNPRSLRFGFPALVTARGSPQAPHHAQNRRATGNPAPSLRMTAAATIYSDSCSVLTCSSRAREYCRSDSRSAWSFLTKVSKRMISNLSF